LIIKYKTGWLILLKDTNSDTGSSFVIRHRGPPYLGLLAGPSGREQHRLRRETFSSRRSNLAGYVVLQGKGVSKGSRENGPRFSTWDTTLHHSSIRHGFEDKESERTEVEEMERQPPTRPRDYLRRMYITWAIWKNPRA